MLESLNSVDWTNLSHAYGKAANVPDQIHALLSETEAERSNALMELSENLVHQGSRFEATPYAVPFLFEIMEHPSCQNHAQIIDLLVSLAAGLSDTLLPHGYDLVYEESVSQQRDVWPKLFEQPQAREAYYAVLERAELFVKYLSPDQALETRRAAGSGRNAD